jgi:hypothetical protein
MIFQSLGKEISIASHWLRNLLDAKLPLVVVMLKKDIGMRTRSIYCVVCISLVDFLHVSIIAALSTILKVLNNMENEAETDAKFWKERLLVVTPHHVQRLQLRNELTSDAYGSFVSECLLFCLIFRYPWHKFWTERADPCIDTVEKGTFITPFSAHVLVQGQERDHVIVDYGINQEAIRNEVRFIYSRNRLNVSITRFVSLMYSYFFANFQSEKEVYCFHVGRFAKSYSRDIRVVRI